MANFMGGQIENGVEFVSIQGDIVAGKAPSRIEGEPMPRPKLFLRDFFWLVALAALGLAWHQERQATRKSLYQVKYELLQARQAQHVWNYAIYTGYAANPSPPAISTTMTTTMTEAQIDEALKFYRVAQPAQ
jgi:hypothetical protein